MEMLQERLLAIYDRLYKHFGPQHWWPGDGPFEVIVGAILTQNTSWKNVEKAIGNLKEGRVLFPLEMVVLDREDLEGMVRPAGYYRLKADRLRHFLDFLVDRYGGCVEAMFAQPLERIRDELLMVKGIGPETADSILLYGGGYPTFVVDVYTRRIFSRHGFIEEGATYPEWQGLFMRSLPRDVQLFNQYHALIVRLGKTHCLPRPRCNGCVLRSWEENNSLFPQGAMRSNRARKGGKGH